MSHPDPDGARKRRRLGGVVLALGGVVVIATVSKDYPREQPIVFRLPDTKPATLVASFTRAGNVEPHAGFTLELPERAFRDVNHVIRVPNGDYIVTVELRRPDATGTGQRDDAGVTRRRTEETSVSRRVSLGGSEVVVPVPARSE
ncbi:MAG TPA: hypothetical protein VFZ53_27665 [Polyangiaceae bacterium]